MFNQQEHLYKIARCGTGKQMVQSLFQMESYDMCSQLYLEMISAYPDEIENKIGLAKCYWMMGKFDEAQLQFKSVLESEQSFNSTVLSEYAHFISRDKQETDEQVIVQLLEFKREQDDSDALSKIALAIHQNSTTHQRHNKSDSIIEKLLEKAKELKPNSIEERYSRAMLYLYNKDKVEQGVKLHQEIIEETEDYRSLFQIGQVLIKLNKFNLALSYLIRSFVANPKEYQALTLILNILGLLNMPEVSLEFAQSTYEKVPSNIGLYRGTSDHLSKLNLKKEAIELLKERVEKDENKIPAWQMLAEMYLANENFDEAINAFEESIKLRNNIDPINYNNLSTIYYKQGNYIKSLEYLQTSLLQNPDRSLPYNSLLEARTKNNVSFDQAKTLYDAFINQYPKLSKYMFEYLKYIKQSHQEDYNYMNIQFKLKNDDHDLSHFIEKHILPDCQKCSCC